MDVAQVCDGIGLGNRHGEAQEYQRPTRKSNARVIRRRKLRTATRRRNLLQRCGVSEGIRTLDFLSHSQVPYRLATLTTGPLQFMQLADGGQEAPLLAAAAAHNEEAANGGLASAAFSESYFRSAQASKLRARLRVPPGVAVRGFMTLFQAATNPFTKTPLPVIAPVDLCDGAELRVRAEGQVYLGGRPLDVAG